MKISVYQTFNGYRVVAGDHRKAAEHLNIQPRTYASAGEAYSMETDDKIRASILRIDPTATDSSTPATRHHVLTGDERKAYIDSPAKQSMNASMYNKAERMKSVTITPKERK